MLGTWLKADQLPVLISLAEVYQELYELKAYGKFGSSRDPDLVDDDEDMI